MMQARRIFRFPLNATTPSHRQAIHKQQYRHQKGRDEMNTLHVGALATFASVGGAIHSSHYRSLSRLIRTRGRLFDKCARNRQRVGGFGHSEGLHVMRRQRYVLQKLLAGVPTDHVALRASPRWREKRFHPKPWRQP
jgi:hypothetical protein